VSITILILIILLALVLIPFGLPGLWLIVLAGIGYTWLYPGTITWTTLGVIALLGVVAEVLEFTLAGKYTRKYGGSTRATWGAIFGGIAGAIVGVPVPLIGSIVGAFAGSFAGALVMELSRGTSAVDSARVAKGALVGRAVAAAMKMGFGIAMGVWVIWAAWR
jgi:uncharacterized protein